MDATDERECFLASGVNDMTLNAIGLAPLAPYSGRGAGGEGLSRFEISDLKLQTPLTLSLSPEYRGEGTKPRAFWAEAAA